MNISSNTQTIETTRQTQTETQVETTEKQSSVSEKNSTESAEKTNSKKDSEFKKLLEPQDTDKISVEQQNIQNQNMQLNNEQLNQNYVDKFGFDVGSSLKNKYSSLFNYDTVKISKEDAKFFSDLVENKQFAVQNNNGKADLIKFSDEIGPTYKTQQTSKVLIDLVNKAYEEGKPVRIDFDGNVSVILKVDKKGKVSAEFIPGDKAVEEYLRNNIRFLKQRLDDQNIGYNDILYRQSKNNQNNNQNKKQNNEGE